MKTLEKVHCHSGTGCQSNGQIPPFLIKRQGQSTFEALLILAAAAVLLLGLLVFAGNEESGSATIFGRTRELVCQLIERGNGSEARSGTTRDDASLSEDDQPLRIPHRPSPSVNRSPQASSERGGDARSMESDRSPLASKPSPTPTYATTPVPTAMPKPPSNTSESLGRPPAPYPTPPAAPAPAPTKTPPSLPSSGTTSTSSSPSSQQQQTGQQSILSSANDGYSNDKSSENRSPKSKRKHEISFKTKVALTSDVDDAVTPQINQVFQYSLTDEEKVWSYKKLELRREYTVAGEFGVGTEKSGELKAKYGYVLKNHLDDEVYFFTIGSIGNKDLNAGFETGFKTKILDDIQVNVALKREIGSKRVGITFEPFEMSYDMKTKETKTKFTFEATYLGWTAAFSLEIPVPGFLEDLGFPQNALDAMPAFAKEWWFME